MTEETSTRVSSEESTANTDASQSRQRKKRKWDQPAEPLVSAGVAGVSGVLPLGNIGSLAGISLPGIASVSGTFLTNQLVANCATSPPAYQVPSIPQNNAMAVPKSNQPKIQDELIIAREIVINDAESSVRYKLTKRQTQEEIQKCTGAVVITRGKYRPPNAAPDGEKPLYLHISAGAHLKDTAERILAVDRAAAMVEEMLKLGPNIQNSLATFPSAAGSGVKALSTCVFLGFDADSSLNIADRIRGPNDQYINHIMNETGATVVLKGRGSGNFESPSGGERQQPIHLFLSANNSKSLEDAKRLAENLLDTISLECGASRVSSYNVYGAVPPPQQILVGVQSSGNEHKVNTSPTAGLTSSAMSSPPRILASSVAIHGTTSAFSHGTVYQSGAMVSPGQPQLNLVGHHQPLVNGGTSYSGYGGIYPQATPLQQVALALRRSTSPTTSTVGPTTSIASNLPAPSTSSIPEKEKRPTQKRKFQELPIGSKASAISHQGSKLLKPGEQALADGVRNTSTMPASKKLVQPSLNGMPPPAPQNMPPPPPRTMSLPPLSNGMPLPPPRTMPPPPPPPPPKFSSSNTGDRLQTKSTVSHKSKSDTVAVVSDTLVKLMEYGEEDDDGEETSEESDPGNSSTVAVRKPFWAL
ncbi:protein RIK isoform X2 [Hevea brasiliensis]|uniref:protein RIK isoform X2 n=1 Tax=Hevea brasiliensis TaxID=3981 RepID=UPI0025EE2958|nr:protein RIK isoform X2 [Hevea brasiliensis]